MRNSKILYGFMVAFVIVAIILFVINNGTAQEKDEISEKKIYVGNSKINGEGLFTDLDFSKGQYITEVGDIEKWERGEEFRTEFCKKVNHQLNGNTIVEQRGSKLYLVADQDIKKGTELTINYKNLPECFDRKTDNYIELTI